MIRKRSGLPSRLSYLHKKYLNGNFTKTVKLLNLYNPRITMATSLKTSSGVTSNDVLEKVCLPVIKHPEFATLFKQLFEKKLPYMNSHSIDLLNIFGVRSASNDVQALLKDSYLRSAANFCDIHWLMLFSTDHYLSQFREYRYKIDAIKDTDMDEDRRSVWEMICTKL